MNQSATSIFRPILIFCAVTYLGWTLWTQTGPFAWITGAQLSLFGSYYPKLTILLTILAVLIVTAAIFIVVMGKPKPEAQRVPPSPLEVKCIWAALIMPALAAIGFALWPVLAPPPEMPAATLDKILAAASAIPAKTSLATPFQGVVADGDDALTVTGVGRTTVYLPLRADQGGELVGVLSGTEKDFEEADQTPRGTPVPAMLVKRPLSYIARRHFEDSGMKVAVFQPTVVMKGTALGVGLPLLLGGGAGLMMLAIYLWEKAKRSPKQ